MSFEIPNPCTVCGHALSSKFLFEKSDDLCNPNKISIFQCGSCDAIFLGKYSNYFDASLYGYYADDVGKTKDQIYSSLVKNSYSKVLQLLGVYGNPKAILDVGCGNGGFVDFVLGQGLQIQGIELSESAVNIAQGFNLPVSKIDFFSNELEKYCFDCITMFEVIEHVPKTFAFIKRAEELLVPGGLLYLTTPNFNSVDRKVLGRRWRVFHPEHLTYFTSKSLINLVKKNTKFEVLYIETRNVSNELISYVINLIPKSIFSRHSHAPKSIEKTVPAILYDNHWRLKYSDSRIFEFIKNIVNAALNFFGVGSTLVIILRKPDSSADPHDRILA